MADKGFIPPIKSDTIAHRQPPTLPKLSERVANDIMIACPPDKMDEYKLLNHLSFEQRELLAKAIKEKNSPLIEDLSAQRIAKQQSAETQEEQ